MANNWQIQNAKSFRLPRVLKILQFAQNLWVFFFFFLRQAIPNSVYLHELNKRHWASNGINTLILVPGVNDSGKLCIITQLPG